MPTPLSTRPYPRAALGAYGVKASDTHVCEWLSDDRQIDLVLGLGDSVSAARADGERVYDEEDMEGGELIVRPISP